MIRIARPLAFALLAGLGWMGTAGAGTLDLGAPAPKLEVKEFVKGEAVKALEPGKIYVVEFWATWCGPCRSTIPHLTELQKKHADVTFIGVSVWEEDPARVKPFVEEMGDKMDYRVALDAVPDKGAGEDGAMAKNWMKAADQDGIPTAFIVDKAGKIAWIGHPAAMDKPLAKIVAGEWDLQTAVAERKKEVEEQAKGVEVQKKLNDALASGDPDKVLAVIADVAKEFPDKVRALDGLKFTMLVQKGEEDPAVELGKKLLEGEVGKSPDYLNNIAWTIVDPKAKHKPGAKLLALAVEAAERGDELAKGKSPFVADTLAKAYFDSGKPAKALEAQKRAVENAKGTDLEDDEDMKNRLEQYKKAVEAGK
jgi:thiol-disulfide isomerase/thioredoxin